MCRDCGGAYGRVRWRGTVHFGVRVSAYACVCVGALSVGVRVCVYLVVSSKMPVNVCRSACVRVLWYVVCQAISLCHDLTQIASHKSSPVTNRSQADRFPEVFVGRRTFHIEWKRV